jgi:hypothetical protein
MVMTIITGVKSSAIIGDQTPDRQSVSARQMSDELGIEIIR